MQYFLFSPFQIQEVAVASDCFCSRSYTYKLIKFVLTYTFNKEAAIELQINQLHLSLRKKYQEKKSQSACVHSASNTVQFTAYTDLAKYVVLF